MSQLDIRLPKLNDSLDYLGEDGDYLLILGYGSEPDSIVEVGVAQRQGDRAVSMGQLGLQTLDYFSVTRALATDQQHLKAYAEGQISLAELVNLLGTQ